jgi:uncharacterized ferredoxin-like protein
MSKGMDLIAELMAIAARTAPKARGQDFVEVSVVVGEDLQRLIEGMKAWETAATRPVFVRNATSLEAADAVVLISIKNSKPCGLNCGACGFESCASVPDPVDRDYRGPSCAMRLLDMGIAIGSAVKTASILNADSRIMYSADVAARKLGLTDGDVVMGIPLAATGKSVFFDRS